MKKFIFFFLLITTFNTFAQSQLSSSNCVPHQIILCFNENPTTLAQTIQNNPACLAASPCVERHPNSCIGLYTSDCGETTEELLQRFQNHPELKFCEPNYIKKPPNFFPRSTPFSISKSPPIPTPSSPINGIFTTPAKSPTA